MPAERSADHAGHLDCLLPYCGTLTRLAGLLETKHRTVSRWNSGESPLEGPARVALRLLCEAHGWPVPPIAAEESGTKLSK